MGRDNFTQQTIKKLKDRVAHRCSNPKCRVPTSAPAGIDRVNNIGIAAHISAASPGGPRYDAEITSSDRSSIDNAIWLCSNCATDIDRDPEYFSTSMLLEWKNTAEETARKELGKPLPEEGDAIDILTTALSGHPRKFLRNAISNIHKASSMSLESLDDRFSVKTSFINDQPSMQILAKEDVELSMHIHRDFTTEYLKKYNELIEHGEDLEISSEAISLSGSKLFEELVNCKDGKIQVSKTKKKAILKLKLINQETQIIDSFDDIHGLITVGNKSFSFKGSMFDGLFGISCKKSLNPPNDKGVFNISLDTKPWEGKALSSLPYLDKLASLFSRMASGWLVKVTLEVEGIVILNSIEMPYNELEFISDTNYFLNYITDCRKISLWLKTPIKFKSEFNCSLENQEKILRTVKVIDTQQTLSTEKLVSNPKNEIIVDEESKNLKFLLEATEPRCLRYKEGSGYFLNIFDQQVELPPRTITFHNILPKIKEDVSKLKPGDSFNVEWIPQENFSWKEEFSVE